MTTLPRGPQQTHRAELLALLYDGRFHDQHEMVKAGGMRFSARIMELRAQGYVIESKREAGERWRYRMVVETGQMSLLP